MNNPNEHVAIKCLTGFDAVADKQRYRIELARVDANYIYLEIHPLLAMDKQFCEKARIALFAPNSKFAYLPASVWVMKFPTIGGQPDKGVNSYRGGPRWQSHDEHSHASSRSRP
jgi:hypothetical protein